MMKITDIMLIHPLWDIGFEYISEFKDNYKNLNEIYLSRTFVLNPFSKYPYIQTCLILL